jgi:hypothetical protein
MTLTSLWVYLLHHHILSLKSDPRVLQQLCLS